MLQQRPDDSMALYRMLLAAVAIEETPRAASVLSRLKSYPQLLTPHQLGRLTVIDSFLNRK
jgi:hypothetical protein